MKKKKAKFSINETKKFKLRKSRHKKNIETLGEQKNQLEIEKSEIEKKYKTLVDEHDNLSRKLEELQNREKIEEKKIRIFRENR